MLTEIGAGLMTHRTHQKLGLQGGHNHQTRSPIEVKPVDDKHHVKYCHMGTANVHKQEAKFTQCVKKERKREIPVMFPNLLHQNTTGIVCNM